MSPVHWPCPLAFQGTGINSHLKLKLQRAGCWKFLLEGVQRRGCLTGMGGFSSLVPSAEAFLFVTEVEPTPEAPTFLNIFTFGGGGASSSYSTVLSLGLGVAAHWGW